MVDFDPSGDFAEIVDGLEAATLSVSGIADQDLLNCHRNQVTNMEVEASNGQVRKGDTIWQWPSAESPTRPVLGSTLTDGAGRVWTIQEVHYQVLSAKWSAVCRELGVEATDDTLITIQLATYAKGVHGALVPTWADAYADVRAQVQPITQTTEVEHDQDETKELYRIILATDLAFSTVGADYRVIDADSQIYSIVSYERPSRIDTFPVIVAERTGVVASSSSSSSSSGA